MNKKKLFLVAFIFLLAVNSVDAVGSVPGGIKTISLSWITPEQAVYTIEPGGSLEISALITCNNGPCIDTTATLQYCSGIGCSNYQNIQVESGELRLTSGTATQLFELLSGSTIVSWNVEWSGAAPGSIYNLKILGTSLGTPNASLIGRQLKMESITVSITVSIASPVDGQEFYIGSKIDFNSNITSTDPNYTVQWDSNKDLEWESNDKNFSSTGLSIGDHNITITGTDSVNTKAIDSAVIHIKPITTDVLSVSDFEIIKIDPVNRFSVNGKIKVKARVNYYLNQAINAKAFIVISNPITNKAIYGPSPFYLNLTEPTYEEYDLNIDLGNYSFQERENYKVEFLVVSNYVKSSPEYFVDPINPESVYWDDGEPYYIPLQQIPEQNKANNSSYEIIELGPATLGDLTKMPETRIELILLILFFSLILLRKK